MKVNIGGMTICSLVVFMMLTVLPGCGSGDSASPSATVDTTLLFQNSSTHFDFYSTNGDVSALPDLTTQLETNYTRITTDIGTTFASRIRVNIYPDLTSFHVAMGRPNDPDWSVGQGSGGQIYMVSPLNPGPAHTYSSLMKTVVHEFVHVAVANYKSSVGGSSIPRWMNEGFAYYEAGQLSASARAGTLPTLVQLSSATSTEFGDMSGYSVSCTIIEYMVATYGLPYCINFIKTPNFSTVFGITSTQFEANWVQHLKDNY